MLLNSARPVSLSLIDADNASAKIADGLFEEIAKIVEASVRRIYGDFSNDRFRDGPLFCRSTPSYRNSSSPIRRERNASDITLVIDAMDLLYSGRFDGFCLVVFRQRFYAARRPHPRARRRCVCGSASRRRRKASRQACRRFVYTETCLAVRRTRRMPARSRRCFNPLMQPSR